jgi:hypothetical protein
VNTPAARLGETTRREEYTCPCSCCCGKRVRTIQTLRPRHDQNQPNHTDPPDHPDQPDQPDQGPAILFVRRRALKRFKTQQQQEERQQQRQQQASPGFHLLSSPRSPVPKSFPIRLSRRSRLSLTSRLPRPVCPCPRRVLIIKSAQRGVGRIGPLLWLFAFTRDSSSICSATRQSAILKSK